MRVIRNKIFIVISVSIFSFIMNFLVFTISYNRLATPFLSEGQRVENANYIMNVTTSLFAIAAVLTGFAFYLLLRWRTKK